MLEAAHATQRVHADPGPSVWLSHFGENAIEFEIQLWIDDPEAGTGNIRSELLKRIWVLFKQHGVQLPYPQRDVHVKEWPALREDKS
jgi:small-conductance mechanosensitive channel